MAREKRDLLEVLKLEFEFLRNGGYWQASNWRPKLIFEDSPTCLKYGDAQHSRPCRECVLMQFVPERYRAEKAPCRHIPLNGRRETLQSMYASATSEEIERQLTDWLMGVIERLEVERATGQTAGASGTSTPSVGRA